MFDFSLKSYLENAVDECSQDGYAQLPFLPQTQGGGTWTLEMLCDKHCLMIDINGDLFWYADFSDFDDLVSCCERIYDGSINPIVE